MPKSTVSRAGGKTDSKANGKPDKPRPDFPLYAHASGRWAKKVRGKTHFFGKWDDPQAALEKWLDQKDDLLAGKKPRPKRNGLKILDLVNSFLTHKKRQLEAGEFAQTSFDQVYRTGQNMLTEFGKNELVEYLEPEDFAKVRSKLAKRLGPVALGNEIGRMRSFFKHAEDSFLIPGRVRFGASFKKPSAKTLRRTRRKKGPRAFTVKELKAVLKEATPNLKAMILLGINGGLGNTDVALLTPEAFDFKGRWLDYPRTKTEVDRRIPLWPETVEAIQAAMKTRPEGAKYCFIGPRGQDYIGNHKGYRVTAEMRRACDRAKVEGRTFYDLRRTFQTIAEGVRDLSAVQSIMGHAPPAGDMSAIYRQGIADDRLRTVVDHVHAWLFPPEKKTKAGQRPRNKGGAK
jgi:integrase